MSLAQQLERTLGHHPRVVVAERRELIREAIRRREAWVASCGALATWTPPDSTGRRPQDTYIVDSPSVHHQVDWSSPYCHPLPEEVFAELWTAALRLLAKKDRLYLTERGLGADPRFALPVRTVTDRALVALFTHNMFRPWPQQPERSHLGSPPFTLLVLPYDRVPKGQFEGSLRSDVVVAMDFHRRLGLVWGSAYLGSVKKLMFTVMNWILPEFEVLPLHCGASLGSEGLALFLGLSGTGKTSLSSAPERRLLGDDEHGWSGEGVFNFEGGCYAKLLGLSQEKEPGIWWAVMHSAPPEDHGTIVENAMIYPDGRFDFHDARLTENSRASYPLEFVPQAVLDGRAGHPQVIFFLTADANGVLPPIAVLEKPQAMFWFLMGYTSKLAGTETGIGEPRSTFSRFFGAPFMPRQPAVYTKLLGEYLDRYRARVYLVNTGWSGGPFGQGQRIDIRLTRAMVQAALAGELERGELREDPRFHLWVPRKCPGVPASVLWPRESWKNQGEYDRRAAALAREFAQHFQEAFSGQDIPPEVAAQCPGS